MMVSRWGQVMLVGMAMASCAQAKVQARPSLLPELSKMAPVITCIDAAPRDANAVLAGCLERAGIPTDKTKPEPETSADFKQLAVLFWITLDRNPKRPLKSESFADAIDYSRCVESAAYADPAFSSRTRKGVEEARLRSALACKDHHLSWLGLNLNDTAMLPDLAERLFAKSLANLALIYALKANGWFPDEMLPCIRYLDGRAPSAGCAGKPEQRSPPPPK